MHSKAADCGRPLGLVRTQSRTTAACIEFRSELPCCSTRQQVGRVEAAFLKDWKFAHPDRRGNYPGAFLKRARGKNVARLFSPIL